MDGPDPAAPPRSGELTVGTRLRCTVCSSGLIVIAKGEADLSCCGQALVAVAPPKR